MNKKLTAALIAAGTLPFAAQALELSVEYDLQGTILPGTLGALAGDSALVATLDTTTGELALGSERSTDLLEGFGTDGNDVLSREVENTLVVNLLTGESGFVRTSGFAATDTGAIADDSSDDTVYASYLVGTAITPTGNGSIDYASAFEANVSAGNLDFTASSELAAFADVSSAADVRAQIQAALGN